MKIYIELLEKYGPTSGLPYGLTECARRYGLKVAE